MKPLWIICLLLSTAPAAIGQEELPCRIRVVDQSNGWPVPLVELETTHQCRFVTDNAGVVAFDLPELMGKETWLHVRSHGYSVAKDGFGYRGVRVTPRAGETVTIEVGRHMPAKRLGRTTGLGLFAESQKLGEALDWQDQGIAGCDSVQNVVHKGKLHWGWGDTSVANYPLGRFQMTGATTSPQPLQSFEPPIRLRYDYVTDEQGKSRNIAEMPGSGPTWLSGYVSVPDAEGKLRLGATYSKIRPPLTTYEEGLCVWNEEEQRFEQLQEVWQQTEEKPKAPPMPHGHPIRWTDEEGTEWLLFGDPFPTLRCRATYDGWASPATWEEIDAQEQVAVRGSTAKVRPHRGSIAWNKFRNKWVAVFTQLGGDWSNLGEIWYAEADSPKGPWADAIKVVTHDKYTFYNPKFHPGWVAEDSPVLLFEGTYTKTFSATDDATPRYDYNQVLYRLDLDDWPWAGDASE